MDPWLAGYLLIGFGVWYVYNSVENALNGGSGAFRYFLREITWYIPGGLARRATHIREIVAPPRGFDAQSWNGTLCGIKQSWTYHGLRQSGNYEACAKDVFKGPVYFWLANIATFTLWPLVLIALFVLMVSSRE